MNHHPQRELVSRDLPPPIRPPSEPSRDALALAQAMRFLYRDWFDFSSDGFLITNLQGVIVEANFAAAQLLSTRKEFLIGKPLGLLMDDRYRGEFYKRLLWLAEAENIEPWEVTVGRPREAPRHVMLTAALVHDEEGGPFLVRWMLRDISLRRRAELAWQEEKGLADSLVEAAEVIILVVNDTGRIVRCNPFLYTIAGYVAQELIGKNWYQTLLPAESWPAARSLLQRSWSEGASKSGILELNVKSGGRRFVTWTARKLRENMVLVGHDVTELQEAQQQALQSERLAAIGQMVAGLAHESRNALQRSQACLSLLQIRLQEQPELVELLARLQHAQDDLQRLFNDVRAYASAPRLELQTCDLRRAWREAWEDLGASQRSGALLREELRDEDAFCTADPFYLKQVFRNLLENALSCGAESVRVTISCRTIPPTPTLPPCGGGWGWGVWLDANSGTR